MPPAGAASLPPVPLRQRLYGFGSVYAKTLRDSRLAFLVAVGLLGGLALFMGAAVGTVFPTPESRLEVDRLIGSMPPRMVNLFGKPEKLGTLGGYMSWKYGAVFALGTGLWSILALAGTLAGEARRGSLDFLAVVPLGRRRIALEKLAAHLTALGLAMAILAVTTSASAALWGDPALGDQIPLLSSAGFALWVGCIALFFGGIAFAIAPLAGEAAAAGIAGSLMVVLWVAHGLDILGPLAALSPFRWTANHVALVGKYDWPGLAMVGLLAALFLAAGVEGFARRDLGVTAGRPLPTVPAWILGTQGPVSRIFGEGLSRALGWGMGLGIMGALLASLVKPMADQIAASPDLLRTFRAVFPGFDLTSAGGFLQLYVQLFYVAAGLAAATFVSKWASDETEGRLELILATPISRPRWVLSAAMAAFLEIVVMTVLFAAGISLGAAAGGLKAGDAVVGSAALGLYAVPVVGIGLAVAGLWQASAAAEAAAMVVIITYLIDLVAPPLGLPDWIHQLALTTHFGEPMLGTWDPVGVGLCLAIGAAGTAAGAWGMARRDVAR
jgi:ABC-2 type transport system permease protein